MVATGNLYLAFSLMVVTNAPLELGMRMFVCNLILNITYKLYFNVPLMLTFKNLVMVQDLDAFGTYTCVIYVREYIIEVYTY
jgi:hypothetical protein